MVLVNERSGNFAEATKHPSIVGHDFILVEYIREVGLHIVRDSF